MSCSRTFGASGGRRRRRRITDEGDEFEEWSYRQPPPNSAPRPGIPAAVGAEVEKEAGARGGDEVSTARSRDEGRAISGKVHSSSGIHEGGGEEEEEQEAGGFLPESEDDDDDDGAAPAAAGASVNKRKGKGKLPAREKSEERSQNGAPWGGNGSDEEGGGFLLPADEVDPMVGSVLRPSLPTEEAEGKGKSGARRQHGTFLSAKSPDSDLRASGRVHANGNRKGKGRLQRLVDTVDFDDDDEEKAIVCKGSDRPGAVRSVEESELDSAAVATVIARNLQEEEDRRAALALQDEINSTSAATVAVADGGGGSGAGAIAATDVETDPLGLLRASGRKRFGPPDSADIEGKAVNRKTGTRASVPCEISGSGQRSSAEDESGGSAAGIGDREIELEIDPKDLVAGGEHSALMDMLSSDAVPMRPAPGVALESLEEEDSDEAFDGFVDDGGDTGEDGGMSHVSVLQRGWLGCGHLAKCGLI